MRSHPLVLFGLSLLLLAPASAHAQWDDELPEEPPPGVESWGKDGSVDDEGPAASREPDPPEQVAPPEPARPAPAAAVESDAPRRQSFDEDAEEPPNLRSVTVGFGGAVATLGGYALPKIPFSGSPDNKFHAFGLGGGLTIQVDMPLADLDWRFGVQGVLPGYLGLQGTVGIKKEIGPWENPKVTTRGAGGLELMVAGLYAEDNAGMPGYAFVVPVVLGVGETAIDFEVVKNLLRLGGAIELAARLGVPIGFGFNAAGWLRAQLLF